ncbi:hypothetical protein ACN9MG_00605 [Burkholderia ambifaria]|uniref:M23 family metallopeptidase n=1 Tax=Burkholderia TaxID=32008 RepID=UPI00158C2268|nr:M23 family metallopeptidase [Burkholderia ambifaria]
MIISPPFLPEEGLTSDAPAATDPMMDAVDTFELSHHGLYPIAFDRRWHCGIHLVPKLRYEPVRAIADGEIVAYRVSQKAVSDGQRDTQGQHVLNCNNGFVLLKHTTDTGDGRTITFYSLYMHLVDIATLAQDRPRIGEPPANSSSMGLAKWLEIDTDGVQGGQGKKVYRKDILGYMGRNHGYSHLHLEIFMTEEDFSAWFEQEGHTVQLGEQHLVQPTSTDYWGHTYFVIPGGTTFVATPPGQDDSPYFPPQSASTLGANSTLYVEAWFHKGQRYVRSWIDPDGKGKLTLLTPEPVRDPCKDYEYNLYQRATDLYKACPSDGYELLRFGRILSTDNPTLPAASHATYVAVPFDTAGTLGYVDVNRRTILKLSDANFPSFMGWRKVDNVNAPLDVAGRWDIDRFREMIGDTAMLYLSERSSEFTLDDEMASYMQGSDEARERLKGFVCHAVSEWDPANNDLRYSGLNEPNGFFGSRADTNPQGYQKFLGFLSKLQFLDQTPLGGGKKFWYFHPLSFMRHFRKCGWLSDRELTQLLPTTLLRKAKGGWVSEPVTMTDRRKKIIQETRVELNRSMRKFAIAPSPRRLAAFFGNSTEETQWFDKLYEQNAAAWYSPWDGRGFLQLTGPDNYIKYWRFRGRAITDTLKTELSTAAKKAHQEQKNDALLDIKHSELTAGMIQWRDDVAVKAIDASQSAGAYWSWTGAAKFADQPTELKREIQIVKGISHAYYSCRSFGQVAATVNFGSPVKNLASIAKVNGIVARYQAYVNAMVVLADYTPFIFADGHVEIVPDGYDRRKA